MAKRKNNKYERIIEEVFFNNFHKDSLSVSFHRDELVSVGESLEIERIKNLGDIVYSFRFRKSLPKRILDSAKDGYEWLIYSTGRSTYEFRLLPVLDLTPKLAFESIEILDATPGIISKYSFNDEQALLAILRYNRIIDVFLGITCYSLQSHLKTSVKNVGSMETDELYIGLDKTGQHYVIPVEAKGKRDKIGRVQIDQDFALCKEKFPELRCIPIAAQFLDNNVIALFRFNKVNDETVISEEKHYKLIPSDLFEYS